MAIANGSFPRHTIDEAILEYVRSRRKGQMVSVSDAVRTMHYLYPQRGQSDKELARMISDAAVRSGCNVSFDSGQKRSELFETPSSR